MRKHERGALYALYDLRHGVGLAGARDAEQRLLVQPGLNARGEGVYGLRLVARGRVFAYNVKFRHCALLDLQIILQFILAQQHFFEKPLNGKNPPA